MSFRIITMLTLTLGLSLNFESAAFAVDKPVALIIAQGGLGDQSYNDLALAGFERALEKTGLKGKPVESKDVVAQAFDVLRRASDSSFGLIIDLEYSHGQPMAEIAKEYPDTTYVILNQTQQGDNIVSLLFQEQEGSYLAGVLAAQVTADPTLKGINEQPILGAIGGTKAIGIDKFISGYIEGARAVNPQILVKIAYSNNFGDPALGQQMAKAMFQEGVDIIYQVAGGTGIGVIQAAKDMGHYAIGVDSDQDDLAPGHVLTSMIKRTDIAVENTIQAYAKGEKLGGKHLAFGLRETGVGLSDMKHTKSLIPAAYLARVEQAKADILSGKIKVWNLVDQGYPAWMK